jgi:excisionase family DNA binding protein
MTARSAGEAADFVTRAEAANLLGVTERTIFNLLRSGALRRSRQGDRRGVRRSDVLSYRDHGGTAKIKKTARVSSVLERRVRHLHQDLEVVVELLDVQRQPLGLGADEVLELYRCAEAFASGTWPPGCERSWVGILLRLDISVLAALATKTGDPDPWRPFFRLRAALEDATSEATALLLRAAEMHLVRLAVEWSEKTHGSRAVQRELRTLGWAPNRDLVRRRQQFDSR